MMVTSGDPQRLAWAWLGTLRTPLFQHPPTSRGHASHAIHAVAIGWIMILCHMVFQRYLNRALAM